MERILYLAMKQISLPYLALKNLNFLSKIAMQSIFTMTGLTLSILSLYDQSTPPWPSARIPRPSSRAAERSRVVTATGRAHEPAL